MTSTDFLEKIDKILDDQDYRITFSLALQKNYMMYCNGRFIGGVFDDELCLVHTDAGNALLHDPEPVYRGYSKNALHRMLPIPLDRAKELLCATYKEKFDGERLAYDVAYILQAYRRYPDDVARLYDDHVLFLKFCHENELLKQSPLDKNDRLIRLVYYHKDLTPKGLLLFNSLLDKYLKFCDRRGKSDPRAMLGKWLADLAEKNGIRLAEALENAAAWAVAAKR